MLPEGGVGGWGGEEIGKKRKKRGKRKRERGERRGGRRERVKVKGSRVNYISLTYHFNLSA